MNLLLSYCVSILGFFSAAGRQSPCLSPEKTIQSDMYPALQTYLEKIKIRSTRIAPERKESLLELAEYISGRLKEQKPVALNFICTHNSRRSHLSQIWAGFFAYHFGLPAVKTYSGGTEATAFNQRAVAALERAGFRVKNPGGSNPLYEVSFSDSTPAMICFSKKYSDPVNPAGDFAAIMTCTQADKACPLVQGADYRLSLPFEDPKAADNTPEESDRYDERCLQIASEMYFVFSSVRKP